MTYFFTVTTPNDVVLNETRTTDETVIVLLVKHFDTDREAGKIKIIVRNEG